MNGAIMKLFCHSRGSGILRHKKQSYAGSQIEYVLVLNIEFQTDLMRMCSGGILAAVYQNVQHLSGLLLVFVNDSDV